MWMMLQQDKPDDYVIATGETRSVQEFVDTAFAHSGVDSSKHLRQEKRLIRPLEVNSVEGDPTKARETLRWKPTRTFEELVRDMVDSDLKRWKAKKRGDDFPWDARVYPDDKNINI